MAGKRIVIPNYMPALDLSGNPVSGAKLTFYDNGTTDLKAIYTSSALTTPHPNPVTANAAGVFPSIFADEDEQFSVAITDANDSPISGLRNRDNVRPSLVYGQGVAEEAAELPVQAPGTGGIELPLGDLLRDLPVSPLAYGAAADGTTNDRTALQAAITYAASVKRRVDLGGYTYAITDDLDLVDGSVICGPGEIVQTVAGKKVFAGSGISNITIRDLTLTGPGSQHLIESDTSKAAIYMLNGSSVTIENVTISDFYNGITLTGGANKRVHACDISSFLLYGIVLSTVDGFIVTENTIYDCDQAGAVNAYCITATGDQAGGDTQLDNIISNNVMYGVPSWDAVMTHEVSRLSCIGNICRNVRMGFDISAASSANPLKDILVVGNIIELSSTNTWGSTAAQHGGVYVGGVSGAVIDGVIVADNLVIGANKIPLGGGSGYGGNIPAAIALQYVKNANVHDNVIRDMGNIASFNAISVFAASDGLQVHNNMAQGTLSNGYMIRVQNSGGGDTLDHVMLTGNQNLMPSVAAHTLLSTGTFSNVVYANNTSDSASAAYSVGGSATVNLANMAAAVAAPAGGATVDTECRAQLSALLTSLRNAKVIAT